MPNYQLLPIPLKQPFSNNGINEAVPYILPSQEDNLNWLEGFTDAFQRPVVPSDLGQPSGRYIRMGQLNQVINNLSTAILNVKQGLDNVQGTIDNDLNAKIDRVVTEANKVINNRKVTWLQTINNQNCAGLKNFTGVNINNFKTSPTAVANLEWCNGMPLKNSYDITSTSLSNYTITLKTAFTYSIFGFFSDRPDYSYFINDVAITEVDTCDTDGGYCNIKTNVNALLSNKDVIKIIIKNINNNRVGEYSY